MTVHTCINATAYFRLRILLACTINRYCMSNTTLTLPRAMHNIASKTFGMKRIFTVTCCVYIYIYIQNTRRIYIVHNTHTLSLIYAFHISLQSANSFHNKNDAWQYNTLIHFVHRCAALQNTALVCIGLNSLHCFLCIFKDILNHFFAHRHIAEQTMLL